MECRALPSSTSALKLSDGDMNAIPEALVHMAGRALLISAGLYAVGQRSNLVKLSVGAALAIEIFAVAYFVATKPKV
jgi:hypothetical protein